MDKKQRRFYAGKQGLLQVVPPRGKARASLAAQCRRIRSVMTGRRGLKFWRIVAIVVEASMDTP